MVSSLSDSNGVHIDGTKVDVAIEDGFFNVQHDPQAISSQDDGHASQDGKEEADVESEEDKHVLVGGSGVNNVQGRDSNVGPTVSDEVHEDAASEEAFTTPIESVEGAGVAGDVVNTVRQARKSLTSKYCSQKRLHRKLQQACSTREITRKHLISFAAVIVLSGTIFYVGQTSTGLYLMGQFHELVGDSSYNPTTSWADTFYLAAAKDGHVKAMSKVAHRLAFPPHRYRELDGEVGRRAELARAREWALAAAELGDMPAAVLAELLGMTQMATLEQQVQELEHTIFHLQGTLGHLTRNVADESHKLRVADAAIVQTLSQIRSELASIVSEMRRLEMMKSTFPSGESPNNMHADTRESSRMHWKQAVTAASSAASHAMRGIKVLARRSKEAVGHVGKELAQDMIEEFSEVKRAGKNFANDLIDELEQVGRVGEEFANNLVDELDQNMRLFSDQLPHVRKQEEGASHDDSAPTNQDEVQLRVKRVILKRHYKQLTRHSPTAALRLPEASRYTVSNSKPKCRKGDAKGTTLCDFDASFSLPLSSQPQRPTLRIIQQADSSFASSDTLGRVQLNIPAVEDIHKSTWWLDGKCNQTQWYDLGDGNALQVQLCAAA